MDAIVLNGMKMMKYNKKYLHVFKFSKCEKNIEIILKDQIVRKKNLTDQHDIKK